MHRNEWPAVVSRQSRVALILALGLFGYPAAAAANFAWPPLIYAYTYAVGWVVLPGLLIETLVYFFAWQPGLLRAVALAVVVNMASALAGGLYVLLSLGLLTIADTPALYSLSTSLLTGFIVASPLLVFTATLTAEYLTGPRLFRLPRSWKTASIFAAANIPSVGLAVYGTIELTGRAVSGRF